MTTAAFFRFFNLGCAISRLTCASVSSPLIANTEGPKPTSRMNNVRCVIQVLFSPLNHPKDSLLKLMPYFSGLGGNGTGECHTVTVHQMIRITTMTVVTLMICSAFSLD